MPKFWTKEELVKFLADHPITTGGAITQYRHSEIKEMDDGDQWLEVTFPFWSSNSEVEISILKMLLAAKEIREGTTKIYLHTPGEVRVAFDTHWCDPD